MNVFVKLFVNWLSLREIIRDVEAKISNNYGLNKLMFIVFDAWIQA